MSGGPADHVPERDLSERDLPERDLPERDLPERDLPERDLAADDPPERDLPDVRHMPGPVRPPWGELDAVVRAALAAGGDLDDVLAAADQVAVEEDLDPRRAAERARALWVQEHGGDESLTEEEDA